MISQELRIAIFRVISMKKEILTQKEIDSFLNSVSFMPTKGTGGIQVGVGQADLALSILKLHVGEFEFEYCDTDFISDKILPFSYYGKFEIEDLAGYLRSLLSANVTIIDVCFEDQYFNM